MYIVETINERAKFNTFAFALKFYADKVAKIDELKNDYKDVDDLPHGTDFEVSIYKNCNIDPDGLHHGFSGDLIDRYSYF